MVEVDGISAESPLAAKEIKFHSFFTFNFHFPRAVILFPCPIWNSAPRTPGNSERKK